MANQKSNLLASDVVDALQLALEGAADVDAFYTVAEAILGKAPVYDQKGTASVKLLVDTLRELEFRFDAVGT